MDQHKHDLEILWEETPGNKGWKRVRCKSPFCDYEEELYYGEEA